MYKDELLANAACTKILLLSGILTSMLLIFYFFCNKCSYLS